MSAESILSRGGGTGDFTTARIGWLIQLRWFAMSGVLIASAFSATGYFGPVAWPVLTCVGAVGLIYNFALWRRQRANPTRRRRESLHQATLDLVLLTLILWAAGGVATPFMGFYMFHVALIAILAGPRSTIVACAAAFSCAGLLVIADMIPALQIGGWDPVAPWDIVAEVSAFIATTVGAAYIVTHAVRELRDRERALEQARDQASLEYQLLSNTLDELEAGLEVIDENGKVLWRNKHAEEIAPFSEAGQEWECPGERRPCERDAGTCPVAAARVDGASGRCRFAHAPSERVYEMLVFPLDEKTKPRVMNLYVDRTHATLQERRLVLAERLASLGRVAQGVAHELNTPLATIRTLAADMRAAIKDLSGDAEAVADVEESAELIRDETKRLGRITQALLAGGDLVRARIDGHVPLAAVVERARAIVFAGVRDGPPVVVCDEIAELEVAVDPDRLMQVLVNLLQNAFDAVRERDGAGVKIEATVEGDLVALSVIDEGEGLEPEFESRLFEPFATTKPPGQGTGLGLYTSYMLARAMGGSLTLQNGETQGAVATVRVPAARADVLLSASALTQERSA